MTAPEMSTGGENFDFGAGEWPGPADVAYFTAVQAGAWGGTLRSFARFAAVPPGSRALDVGTGPGLLPRVLAESGVRLAVGCDDSLAMLRAAARPGAASGAGAALAQAGVAAWAAAGALRLPFARGAFDAGLATNLFFLLPDPGAGLAELARVVRPGGTVAALNPSGEMSVATASAFVERQGLAGFGRFSFVNYARLAEEYHRLSAGQWQALAAAAGLEAVQTETRAGGLIVFLRGNVALTPARLRRV